MEENPQGLERFVARQQRKRHLAAVWAALAGLEPGMIAADIGCGPGILTREYGRITGPRGRVHGVEPDTRLAPWLEPGENVLFLFRSFDSVLNLPDVPDIMFLTDTLHHLAKPDLLLRNIRAACGARTRLFIAEYDPAQPGLVGAKPHRRMAKPLLCELVAAAGFRQERLVDTEDEHYAMIARC